jgi:hypothetical protein
MTSKQVMLTAWCLMGLMLAGCGTSQRDGLISPHPGREVWAVAPLRNESGTGQADGLTLADKLARQLETAEGIEVLPVNRVLAAMEQKQLRAIDSREDAQSIRQALQADGLVLGTITAFDPYEPPKLGLALELYVGRSRAGWPLNVRQLTKSATGGSREPAEEVTRQPVATVSGFYNAADPAVREQMHGYAEDRGSVEDPAGSPRLYRISMDLYSEFVSYAMLDRLLEAERARVTPSESPTTQPAS